MTPEQIEGLPAQLQLVANRSFAGQMKADDWRTVDDASHAITQLQEHNAKLEKEVIGLESSNGALLKDYLGACDEAAKYSSRYDTATLSIKALAEKNAKLQTHIQYLEAVNAQRKSLNAQMLMNAAGSGNRNYLAEIEQLTEQNANYKAQIKELVKQKYRREE